MTRVIGLTAFAGSAALLAAPRARAAAQDATAQRAAAQRPHTAAQVPAQVPAQARALAERIRRVRTGSARLTYAARPGVCGDGADDIQVGTATGVRRVGQWTGRTGGAWQTCEPGPAHVTIAVRDGVPRMLRLAVGGRRGGLGRGTPDSEDATPRVGGDVFDLGVVAGAVAAAYLLDVAAHAEGATAERAVLAAAVADSAVIWPDLLRLARADGASPGARHAATFWAGQFACDAVRSRATPARGADTLDRDVRTQVVFALSQRATDERTPMLTRVARTDRDPEVRCSALFWLGQTAPSPGGTRVALDLYEDVLRAR